MAGAQSITYLRVKLNDQPGALLQIMEELKKKNIALKALWGFGKQGGEAELYAVPKDPAKLISLWQNAGILIEEGKGFFLKGTDKTGALLKCLKQISDQNINIKAIQAIAVSGKYGTLILVDSSDLEKTAKTLGVK